MYNNLISQDYLMHHGVKGMKWGVRHDPERSARGAFHRGMSKVYSLNEKAYRKLGNNTLASMNAAAKTEQLKKAKAADKYKTDRKAAVNRMANTGRKLTSEGRQNDMNAVNKMVSRYESDMKKAKQNFAKGVGKTYKANEFVEKKKEKAWSKISDKSVIGKYASKKQNTAKENAKFYEQTRNDLTSGKVAPAKTKYQKFVRAAFFKNPAGRLLTYSSIKTSPYLKNGQQKATALAEMGLLSNYYKEQKKNKKEGKPYHKY